MTREDLIRFAERDWAAVAAAKEQHWLRQKRSMSPAEVSLLGDEMRRYARARRPDWPSLSERLADLETHQRVGLALRAITRPSR